MGNWTESNFVSVVQVVGLNNKLSIGVTSGDVGCFCGPAGILVGEFVFELMWFALK